MGQAAGQEQGGTVKTHTCSQKPPTGPHARPLAVGPGCSVSLWPARGRGAASLPTSWPPPRTGHQVMAEGGPGGQARAQRGVFTCCRASGRPLTTGSGRCPRPWLSSCDERADGGLGHAQAGSAVLPPGGAVPQHSGAVAASPAPMDPKPPSRRKAEGPDAATRCRPPRAAVGLSPLGTGTRVGAGPSASSPWEPAAHASESPGRGPASAGRSREVPFRRWACKSSLALAVTWEPAVPRALSPQRSGQQGGDTVGPNSTCPPGSNALWADGRGGARTRRDGAGGSAHY